MDCREIWLDGSFLLDDISIPVWISEHGEGHTDGSIRSEGTKLHEFSFFPWNRRIRGARFEYEHGSTGISEQGQSNKKSTRQCIAL